jgi:hypothetical protein
MCNMVYLSTDSADDLAPRSSDLVRFEKPSSNPQSAPPAALKHEHRWFVGSRSGCSCGFRHLVHQSVGLGFGEPEDWFPEDRQDLEATVSLYEVLKDLVQRGHQVEVLDCWSGDEGAAFVPLVVSLSQVPAGHFRLFEGHVFTLTA